MKKLITLSAFAVASFLVLQPNFIFTNSAQPPAGHTGAPGENTCAVSGCHTGTVNANSSLILLSTVGANNLNSGYTAGTTYNMSLNVASINKPEYGFELTALDDNGAAAGTFAITNNNATALTNVGGKSYVSHKNANSTAAWSFQWTAPQSGNVTFYLAVNGANGTNSAAGDMIFTTAYTVSTSEGLTRVGGGTGIEVLNADENNISIYPNPAKDKILMQYSLENDATASIELYNLNGQVMQTFFNGKQAQGKHNQVFELNNNISKGLYLVRFNVGEKVFFKKLLVD